MAANFYSKIPDDLKYVADTLEENGFNYKIFNGGKQFNAEDKKGVWQEFFPTTGTIKVHKVNGWGRQIPAPAVIHNSNLEEFIKLLTASDEKINKLFN